MKKQSEAPLPNRFVFIEANLTHVLEVLDERYGTVNLEQVFQMFADYTPKGWHVFEYMIYVSKHIPALHELLKERKSFAQRRELVAKRKQWQTKT